MKQINSMKLGENPYSKLTDKQFIKQYDLYINAPHDFNCSLSIYACFTIALLIEYNKRFRPKKSTLK